MRVAWCPQHRGVMRISFFDPKPPHFDNPCPRCQGVLVEQIRNKYSLTNPGAVEPKDQVNGEFPDFSEEQEIVIHAPRRICECCCVAELTHGNTLCGWCIDCPTEYCDVPTKFKKILSPLFKKGNK